MTLLSWQTMFGGGLWLIPLFGLIFILVGAYYMKKAHDKGMGHYNEYGKWIPGDKSWKGIWNSKPFIVLLGGIATELFFFIFQIIEG